MTESKTVVTTQVTRSEGHTVVTTGNRDWSTSTFSCFDDVKICLCGLFCGICYACTLSKDMGESCLVPWCVQGGTIAMRTKLRMMLGIQGSICNDCIMLSCLGPCTLCQMGREMKQAGFTSH